MRARRQEKDGVGKATKHMCADIQCTGEALYVDDMPNPPGGLYAGLVRAAPMA